MATLMQVLNPFTWFKPTTPQITNSPTPSADKSMQPMQGELQPGSTERGQRATPEQALHRIMRQMWVDTTLRAAILQIRDMDRRDGRVKKIHLRTSRAAAKGGIKLTASGAPAWLTNAFDAYQSRLHLDRRDKLESDVRGLMMEGNLPMQWVLDKDQANVVGAVRMPAETIKPLVGPSGIFEMPAKAYEQWDLYQGRPIAVFGLWQLGVARLTPDNYDDFGSLGRPYLDATRSIWQQLNMTEEDLVVRRRMRAPLRMSHTLEGASESELTAYKLSVEQDQAAGNYRDYYSNRKGSVTAVQGDTNLEQIADVAYLLDNFFAGAPAPRGLFGYTKDIARDILADLKEDFFDEIDALQDNVSWIYEEGFRLQLLLQGKNPDAYDFCVGFAERRTDTPNQRADLALKYQALGMARETVWDATGIDVNAAVAAKDEEVANADPYAGAGDGGVVPGETPPPGGDIAPPNVAPIRPNVAITPGNARKGQSATTISSTRAMP